MKKVLVLLLLTVYGISSSGMTLHVHYCCGKLDRISLEPVTGKDCGPAKKMTHKSCCDYKQVQFSIKGEQKTETAIKALAQVSTLPAAHHPECSRQDIRKEVLVPEVFAPPPLSYSLTVFHCVFRI